MQYKPGPELANLKRNRKQIVLGELQTTKRQFLNSLEGKQMSDFIVEHLTNLLR